VDEVEVEVVVVEVGYSRRIGWWWWKPRLVQAHETLLPLYSLCLPSFRGTYMYRREGALTMPSLFLSAPIPP